MVNSTESVSKLPSNIEKIVLFDLDGTLINRDYQLTFPGMHDVIEMAQNAGWRIGLSSDTPIDGMITWHKRLGMNGPIVAEKGALFATGRQQNAKLVAEHGYAFRSLREKIIDYLLAKTVNVWQGDPAAFIRSGASLPFEARSGESVVLVNKFRTESFGCFMRVINSDGQLQIHDDVTRSIAAEIRDLYPSDIEIGEDYNEDHGLLIVHDARINKRFGTKALLDELGIQKLVMVGNSEADYIGEDIAYHIAVGDATSELKLKANCVTVGPVTEGAIEALKFLVTQQEGA